MVYLEQQQDDADILADDRTEPVLSHFPVAWDLKDIVAELRVSRDVTHNVRDLGRLRPPPLRRAIDEALTDFPRSFSPPFNLTLS